MLSAYALDSFGDLRLCVLDDMAFVENTIQPVKTLELSNIIPNNFVRGYDNVVRAQHGEQLVSFSSVAGI